MIRTKGSKILQIIYIRLPADKRIIPKLSEEWLVGLRDAGASFQLDRMESGDEDIDAFNLALTGSGQLILEYRSEDVLNADECGMAYRMEQDKTIEHHSLKANEKEKG